MPPDFYTYFSRGQNHPEFNAADYKSRLRVRTKNGREVQLVNDCFGKHLAYRNPSLRGLNFLPNMPTRWIAEDEISAYFINVYYTPPELKAHETNRAISLNEFIVDAISTAVVPSAIEQNNLGSNRLRFVLADPGQGKTALIGKLITEIERPRKQGEKPWDPIFELICVRLDLEDIYNYNRNDPKPLTPDFTKNLFKEIKRTADSRLRSQNVKLPAIWEQLSPDGAEADPVICIQRLVVELRKLKYRLIIFIDNIDFYQYFWQRHIFFEKYNSQKEKMIDDNIRWLRKELISDQAFGNSGLCVIMAMRTSTYQDVFNGFEGVDTAGFSSTAVELAPVSYLKVIGSRIDMLSAAITIVGHNRRPDSESHDRLLNLLNVLQDKFQFASTANNSESPLHIISILGQHEHRSLVEFLSTLNFGYDEADLLERFFANEPVALLELYFNWNFKKYSQSQKHFPNLFLNDSRVSPDGRFAEAYTEHVHTYWLKYLVLAYTKLQGFSTYSELHREFCVRGKYSENLLRLVLGSLSTTDEFCCLALSADTNIEMVHRRLKITRRGQTLLNNFHGVPLCFSFRYLSAISDDFLLAYPKESMSHIFDPTVDSSVLYEGGDRYTEQSARKIRRKAAACLHFLKILEDSLEAEVAHGIQAPDGITAELRSAINFRDYEENVITGVEAIYKKLRGPSDAIALTSELRSNLSRRPTYRSFFRSYFHSGVMVQT